MPIPTAELFRDPNGVFLHDAVLAACSEHPGNTAIIDTSSNPPHRITYSEYGELLEACARNLAAQVHPGEVIAIFLTNSWEYAVAFHAAGLAGAIPTLLNPSYREREVRYQLENSGAVALITDALQIEGISLAGMPALRKLWTTRHHTGASSPFAELLTRSSTPLPTATHPPDEVLAALPYSSGTTGLPKGVMLSHQNLVANCYQYLRAPKHLGRELHARVLCFLPLYHIYGLNVLLNPTLLAGGTLVLMPRFDCERALENLVRHGITYLPQVPPVINAFCQAAEAGRFPRDHKLIGCKSGAAPLAPELARRFCELTGTRLRQGYGMTEASPVTHLGWFEPELYRPESIGQAVALTDCMLVDEAGATVSDGLPGELVMRGPQFMRGYWNAPEATAEVIRDGWFWSGDVAVRDEHGFYSIVDRRKEMIKFKGFPIAPAEVEAVLLEHPAVRDCGVVGHKDDSAGEVPCAFVVAREGHAACAALADELCSYVAERLVSYKQPRQVRFVTAIPRNPSGKILRKDLRAQL